MRHLQLYILLLFTAVCFAGNVSDMAPHHRQDTLFTAVADTVSLSDSVILTDTVAFATADTAIVLPWRPDPAKATWLAVVIPGAGQIYNRSYWKLPIVYGGLMGCTYAVIWNHGLYSDYKEAYRDILLDTNLSTDPERSYNAILPKGYTIKSMGGRSQYTSTLKDKQSLYRRYRDLSIVATVAVYVLTIIDAYVDAQLFDYDISPDLTLNVEPQIIYDRQQQQRSAEVKMALNF